MHRSAEEKKKKTLMAKNTSHVVLIRSICCIFIKQDRTEWLLGVSSLVGCAI